MHTSNIRYMEKCKIRDLRIEVKEKEITSMYCMAYNTKHSEVTLNDQFRRNGACPLVAFNY